MKIDVILVGLGSIGFEYDLNLEPDKYVFTHARAFSLHESFQLVCAVDPDVDRRNLFYKKYQLPVYSSLSQAYEYHKPQLVVIAAPTHLHKELVDQTLATYQPRAILCEKPLSGCVEEATAIISNCLQRGVKLFVNYIRRCDPGVIEVRRRIVNNELVIPVKGIVWYSKGIIHNGSHFLNLLEYWLGPLQSVSVLSKGRLWANRDPEPDISLGFGAGSVVMQSTWEEAFSHHTVELMSTSGRLRYEYKGQSIHWQASSPDPLLPRYRVIDQHPEIINVDMNRYQLNVANHLELALIGKPSSICSGLEALMTLQSISKIIETLA